MFQKVAIYPLMKKLAVGIFKFPDYAMSKFNYRNIPDEIKSDSCSNYRGCTYGPMEWLLIKVPNTFGLNITFTKHFYTHLRPRCGCSRIEIWFLSDLSEIFFIMESLCHNMGQVFCGDLPP